MACELGNVNIATMLIQNGASAEIKRFVSRIQSVSNLMYSFSLVLWSTDWLQDHKSPLDLVSDPVKKSAIQDAMSAVIAHVDAADAAMLSAVRMSEAGAEED